MPIPGPGIAISMDTIATEFGGSVPHSLDEYYRGGGLVNSSNPLNAAIPTSGTISMSDFYGSNSRVPIPIYLGPGGTLYSYNLWDNRGPTYVAGKSDIDLQLGTNLVPTAPTAAGAKVGAASTSQAALLVPNQFSPGDTVTITMGWGAKIYGAGGTGGNHPYTPDNFASLPFPYPPTPAGYPSFFNAGLPGQPGGPGLVVQRPITIRGDPILPASQGSARIGGGGGGGGAGGMGGRFIPRPPFQGGSYGGHQHFSGGGGGGGVNPGPPWQGGPPGDLGFTTSSTSFPAPGTPNNRHYGANPGGWRQPQAPSFNDTFGNGGPGGFFTYPYPTPQAPRASPPPQFSGGNGGGAGSSGQVGGYLAVPGPGVPAPQFGVAAIHPGVLPIGGGGAGGAAGAAITGNSFITFSNININLQGSRS